MGLFDSHCHLDAPAFDEDRGALLARARDAGVTGWLVPGVHPDGWDRLLRLRGRHPGVRVALGVHPYALESLSPAAERAALEALPDRLRLEDASAVGECGLDRRLVHRGVSWERQLRVLQAHLEIARALDLPVILHGVRAHGRMLGALEGAGVRGILHAFTGPAELIPRYAAAGLWFGFGGAVTHPRARRVREAARACPSDRLLLETDAPDAPPAGRPGRNEPAWLVEVHAELTALRGASPSANDPFGWAAG